MRVQSRGRCHFDRDVARYSPDRVDALVWGFTELMAKRMTSWALYDQIRRQSNELDAKRAAEGNKSM